MKSLSLLRQVVVAAVAVSAMAVSFQATADDDFRRTPLYRLRGSFGFQAQGYFGANYDAATQQTTGAVAERVGVYTFDGKGNCKIHSIANKAGLAEAVIQDTAEGECTYVIYDDGTGQVDARLGGKTFYTFFVLVKHDTEFMFTRREGINNPTADGGASLIFGIGKRQ
ncbi:MAG: hypothetical protein FIA97_17230 [Methylococcaceae bacterium]|nr:hypothetical protein [Methylococcaceae bacterium]